jgi:transposase
MRSRRKFTSKFKTKVVLEALSERYTMSQLAEKHQLHPNQISTWKLQFLQNAESVFDKGVKSPEQKKNEEKDKLLKTIGKLKVENDFLKDALR